MLQIKIKELPGIGESDGTWELIEFSEFILSHAPQLRMYVHVCHQFPPLHIINEELLSGGRDQGMSGACFWKPFELSQEDYNEIKEEMLTNPDFNLDFDEELAERKTLSKWCGAVLSKHNRRNKDRGNAI